MANPGFLLPRVTGPAKVSVNLRDAGTNVLVDLGWTSDGVEPRFISPMRAVTSDRQGGSEGTPVDYQRFGESAKIDLQLVEYNLTALLSLKNRHTSTADVTTGVQTAVTSGKITNIGCLESQKGSSIQLIIQGTKDAAEILAGGSPLTLSPMNFPNCFLDGDFVIPTGSKNSVVSLSFTALPFTAWDTGNSGSGNTWLYIPGTTLVPRLERYAT
jgi:hypothetical protein